MIFVLDVKIINSRRFTITATLLQSCYQLNDVMSKSSKRKFVEVASPDAQLIKKLHKLIGKHVFYASRKKIIPQLYLLSNFHNMIQIKRNLHIMKLQKIVGNFTNIVTCYQQFFEHTLKTIKQVKIQYHSLSNKKQYFIRLV